MITTDVELEVGAVEVALTVIEEIRTYLPGEFERNGHELEALLLKDGRAIDPIVYWMDGGKNVVIDGHRRLDICTRHKLPYQTLEMKFTSLREVKHWMDCNQSSRRNLTAAEILTVVGRLDEYLNEEKLAGRFTGEIDKQIAKSLGRSDRQVRRDREHLRDLDKLEGTVKARVLAKELPISVAALAELALLPHREQLNVMAQVDKGEFKTLGEAVTGDVSDDPAATFDDIDPGKPGSGKSAARPDKKPAKHRPVDPTRNLAQSEAKALEEQPPESEARETIPMGPPPTDPCLTHQEELESATALEIIDGMIKNLGMLSKGLDKLNELSPDAARMSSMTSNISNIRNSIKMWARAVA